MNASFIVMDSRHARVSRFSKPAPHARAKRLQWKTALRAATAGVTYPSFTREIFAINISRTKNNKSFHSWDCFFTLQDDIFHCRYSFVVIHFKPEWPSIKNDLRQNKITFFTGLQRLTIFSSTGNMSSVNSMVFSNIYTAGLCVNYILLYWVGSIKVLFNPVQDRSTMLDENFNHIVKPDPTSSDVTQYM